jgi:hypothetical protein
MVYTTDKRGKFGLDGSVFASSEVAFPMNQWQEKPWDGNTPYLLGYGPPLTMVTLYIYSDRLVITRFQLSWCQ